MTIWISVLVVLCLINAHVSANSKTGCVNAVTISSGNGFQVYACQVQNKDNNIKWIRNGAGMQIVLATCLHGSTTCLTTQTSVSALRTKNGTSQLKIVGDVDGSDIECHESSDSEDVTCLQRSTENPTSKQSVVPITSAQDVIRGNTPAVSKPLNNVSEETVVTTFAPTRTSSQDPNENPTSTKKTSYVVSTLKGNLITGTTDFHPQTLTQSGNTLEDSTILKRKTTVSFTFGLDTTVHVTLMNILPTTEKNQQVSSGDSSVSGSVTDLSPLSNITKLSAQRGTTSLGIIGEGTLSSGTKHIPARTTVSPATVSTQPEALTYENSHITNYSEISSQTNTRYLVLASGSPHVSGSTMSSLPIAPKYSLSTEGELSMDSTTVSYQNKPHVSLSLGSVSTSSSTPMPFVNTEPSVRHPQRNVSVHDNTKGLSSGDSSTSIHKSTEADIYVSPSNRLRSITEVSTTPSQFHVQTNRGPSSDDKTTKNNIVNQDPHRTSGTSSTASPIPTSHDKHTPASIIVGIIAAVLGVVVLGTLYILICKHHRDSMTFSNDEPSKEFIYCNIAYENEVNDEAKKVREAPRTLKANRRLSMSKTCVLREEIESPDVLVATDANSVKKVGTASVSMETESLSINSAEAYDTHNDVSLFAGTSPGASSLEQNASESSISDYGDEVAQHEENQKDLFSPNSVVNRTNIMPSTPRKAFIWRSLYDKMLFEEDDIEDTLYTAILIAKPSSCRRSIMKSRGLLEPVNESEEDLYVEGKKPKKVVSFGDAEYATVSHEPRGGEDSKEIQLQDTCPDSLQPPVYAVVNKLAPD